MIEQKFEDIQKKILEILVYVDKVCKDNNINYYIMGGTALGAVRHAGFIPWDDDIDIFMTPDNYEKFKNILQKENQDKFVIQEWKTNDKYLEYAKVRMNGTTFIEKNLKHIRDMHHGIYLDIMILHKAPKNNLLKKIVYFQCKYVTLLGLSQRNWVPKTKIQKIILTVLKLLPNKLLSYYCYENIYRYNNATDFNEYFYWITPANYKEGLFSKDIFQEGKEVLFENIIVNAPTRIKDYLKIRYGDYMKLPPKEQQVKAIHAEFYDINRGYEEYIR